MNKQDLMREMSERTGISQRDCGLLIECLSEIIVTCLQDDEYVKLPRLGSLYPVRQNSRPGRNPRNGVKCMIPERISTRFKISQYLLNALNEKEKESVK